MSQIAPRHTREELQKVFVLHPAEGKYIDPVKLLQYLERFATILAEHTAIPGLEPVKTELARGQRLNCLAMIQAIKEEMSHARPDQ